MLGSLKTEFDVAAAFPDSLMFPGRLLDEFNIREFMLSNKSLRGATLPLSKWRDPETGLYVWDLIRKSCAETLLSPKFMCVVLQREQSLLGAKPLTDYRLDRACGQAVYDPDPKASAKVQAKRAAITARNKGLKNQILGCAHNYRQEFLDWKDGVTIRINYDTEVVAPRNAATFALLRYTPHTHTLRFTRDQYRFYFGDEV